MTPEEFAQRMQEISEYESVQASHIAGDDLMCELLEDLGYGDGVQIFYNMDKWYA